MKKQVEQMYRPRIEDGDNGRLERLLVGEEVG